MNRVWDNLAFFIYGLAIGAFSIVVMSGAHPEIVISRGIGMGVSTVLIVGLYAAYERWFCKRHRRV